MPEAVANLVPSGSGRFLDWICPSSMTGLNSSGPDMTSRNGQQNVSGTSVGYGGGTTNTLAVQLGVPCIKQTSTALGAGNGLVFTPPVHLMLRTSRNAIVPRTDDQFVYRLIWIFAGNGDAINAGLDFGLEFLRANSNNRILIEAADGFGFRIADSHVLQWIVRGPNGLVTLNLTAAPFDTSAWHSLDVRIFSATSTADASLSVRLDDVPVSLGGLNSSWAAGTNLPAESLVGGVMGFRPILMCTGAGPTALYTHRVQYITANSELMTL